MAKITIDVRKRIPKTVLLGHVERYKPVHTVFKNTLIVEFISQIHDSYIARSQGDSDDYGNTWKSLKRSTVEFKKGLKQSGDLGSFINSRMSQRLKQRMTSVLDQFGFDSTTDGINIRTGELITAYTPPLVGSNNVLYPNPGQSISVDGLRLRFDVDVDHADAVDASGRPIIPVSYTHLTLPTKA